MCILHLSHALSFMYSFCVDANCNRLTDVCLNVCGTLLPGFEHSAYKEVGVHIKRWVLYND